MQIHSCSLQPGHSLSTALPWSCHRCLRAAPRASLGSSVAALHWSTAVSYTSLAVTVTVDFSSPCSSRRASSYKVRGAAASHEAPTCRSRRPFSTRPRGHTDTLFTGRVKLGPCRAGQRKARISDTSWRRRLTRALISRLDTHVPGGDGCRGRRQGGVRR